MPLETCRAGAMDDMERRDGTYIEAVRASLRAAAYCMGPGTGSWHREMWVELADNMALFCDKRGSLGNIQEKAVQLHEDITSGWAAHRLTQPLWTAISCTAALDVTASKPPSDRMENKIVVHILYIENAMKVLPWSVPPCDAVKPHMAAPVLTECGASRNMNSRYTKIKPI
ncbi:hypothetical protein NLG97_g1117 [Lecanicillium saksenae]|uniref:Uncharacterized protein n=1 Tax=Lecanicillium saksenae TaxID=468837 RepID=A0ACC1R4W0_9HYPO|nr:hypothetical protein NLG97_g1117 [Lecanicillium saksenae]